MIPGTGIVASGRGQQSRPDPAHPCGVVPGKRPRLTPNPALAVRDDGSVLAFGCPGGDMRVQAMLQVFLNAFHFGMDVQQAIDAPRFSSWSFPNSFAPFEYLPGRVGIEGRFPDAVLDELTATTSSPGPNSPVTPRRWRRSTPRRGPRSSAPVPTRASRPTRSPREYSRGGNGAGVRTHTHTIMSRHMTSGTSVGVLPAHGGGRRGVYVPGW